MACKAGATRVQSSWWLVALGDPFGHGITDTHLESIRIQNGYALCISRIIRLRLLHLHVRHVIEKAVRLFGMSFHLGKAHANLPMTQH